MHQLGTMMVQLKSVAFKARTFTKKAISSISVEPLMLLDGLAFSNMHVYIENLHMDRVCQVNSGYSEDVCHNLKASPSASIEVQQKYSVFALYNGIIAAALPLFFILFMGAWSDKYGRKVPLVAVEVGHLLHAGGYLLASLEPHWPVEFFLLVTLLDTLGGGAVSFLMVANSYISDVSSEKSRTSRVGLANSIWFLGGPIGTLLGTYIFKKGGYLLLFTTSLTLSMAAVIYIIVFLPESHGPFAKKKDHGASKETKLPAKASKNPVEPFGSSNAGDNTNSERINLKIMVRDFFNPQRILDSFSSILKRREGNARALILLLIFTSLLRRLARSPYVFAYTRHELGWKATDYSLWVTYKNVLATAGSMVAVPLLSGHFGVSDNILAMLGAMSGVIEYVVYGFVSETQPKLIWFAPVAGLLLNSCSIAQRSMMTKIITTDEIGKVSAVLGALDGMMPMVSSALYTAVYHSSVRTFPSAHFFVGAAISTLMMAVFSIIIMQSRASAQRSVKEQKLEQAVGLISNDSSMTKADSEEITTKILLKDATKTRGNSLRYEIIPSQDFQPDSLAHQTSDAKIPGLEDLHQDKSVSSGLDFQIPAQKEDTKVGEMISRTTELKKDGEMASRAPEVRIPVHIEFQDDGERHSLVSSIKISVQEYHYHSNAISRAPGAKSRQWSRQISLGFKRFLGLFQK